MMCVSLGFCCFVRFLGLCKSTWQHSRLFPSFTPVFTYFPFAAFFCVCVVSCFFSSLCSFSSHFRKEAVYQFYWVFIPLRSIILHTLLLQYLGDRHRVIYPRFPTWSFSFFFLPSCFFARKLNSLKPCFLIFDSFGESRWWKDDTR